ncbi:MAG: hypothetical protein ACR2NX_11220 [Chthoniobacterales bacterium]
MRPLLLLALTSFFLGCANEGVVVDKTAEPQPFYHSLGVEGSYALLLRDRSGSVHRQLVTPEVYGRYAVGQYFNDLQPASDNPMPPDSKSMAIDPARTPAPAILASMKKHSHGHIARITTHRTKTHRHLARRHTRRNGATKRVALMQSAPKIAQAKPEPALFATIARCR